MQNTLTNLFKQMTIRPNFGLITMKRAGRDFKGMRPQQEVMKKDIKKLAQRDQEIIKNNYKGGFTHEELENSSEMVKKVFSLENASPKEILQFKIQQAVQKFQRAPNDTSSTGVQIAVMTERIYHLIGHTEGMRKDVKAARYLNELLDHRRKKLNYLRHKDYHFYKYVINEYNIPENPPLNHHEKDSYRLFKNKVAPVAPQRRR